MASSSGPFTIRRAAADDAPALASLQRALALFSSLEGEAPEATQTRVARQLGRCLADDSHAVFVALAPDGEVVGYASVHWLPYLIHAGPEGYVSELFVGEPSRGAGLGTRLLEAVEAAARERGCVRLQLLNFRTRASYLRGFYPKVGWLERPDGASFVKALA